MQTHAWLSAVFGGCEATPAQLPGPSALRTNLMVATIYQAHGGLVAGRGDAENLQGKPSFGHPPASFHIFVLRRPIQETAHHKVPSDDAADTLDSIANFGQHVARARPENSVLRLLDLSAPPQRGELGVHAVVDVLDITLCLRDLERPIRI